MAHNYEVGTRAWQPDPTEGWVASEVKEKLVDGDKVQLVFLIENGEVRTILSVRLSHIEDMISTDKFMCKDKNSGNYPGRVAGRQQSKTAALDESCHARSQRRPYEPVSSE